VGDGVYDGECDARETLSKGIMESTGGSEKNRSRLRRGEK